MSPPAAGNTRVLLNAVKLPVLLVSDAVLKFKLCVCVCLSVGTRLILQHVKPVQSTFSRPRPAGKDSI